MPSVTELNMTLLLRQSFGALCLSSDPDNCRLSQLSFMTITETDSFTYKSKDQNIRHNQPIWLLNDDSFHNYTF